MFDITTIKYNRCIRRPRTTQERRMWYKYKDIVKIRGKRRQRRLPEHWDDKFITSLHYKGWKREKNKKQWMVNNH